MLSGEWVLLPPLLVEFFGSTLSDGFEELTVGGADGDFLDIIVGFGVGIGRVDGSAKATLR